MSTPKKIGIDIRLIGKGRTGDEVVFRELVRALIRRCDPGIQYELYTDETADATLAALYTKLGCLGREDVDIISLPASNRFLWNGFVLPWRLAHYPVDVFHTQYILPLVLPRSTKVFVHIHDVSFRAHPEWIGVMDRFFLDLLIPRTIERADTIIAPSEFTKAEIGKYYPEAREKIEVVPNAVAEEWSEPIPREERVRVAQKFGLTVGQYFVSSGTMQPRKNIPFLIRCFEEVHARSGFRDTLVLTGKRAGHNVDPLLDQAEGVVFTDYLSDHELRALIAGSKALVFPSLYEGFGLPILEARALGRPVLASDIPVFHEIGGANITYFNPLDLAQAAETLYTFSIAQEGEASLAAPKNEVAIPYSWEKSAALLATLYARG